MSLGAPSRTWYEFTEASLEPPADGVFLRGRLTRNHPPYRVRYGIEAFFAPKEKALPLEEDLRNGGIAVLMVAGNGRTALKDVIPDPNPNTETAPGSETGSDTGRE